MISKRVERGDPVDVLSLLKESREALSEAEKKFR